MNQAVLAVTSYFRSTSRALMPFFAEHMSTMTNNHVRTETFVPWKIVPVSTENCLRQAPHFHTRRADREPVRVARLEPFSGLRK
jgi:hypothetical protein